MAPIKFYTDAAQSTSDIYNTSFNIVHLPVKQRSQARALTPSSSPRAIVDDLLAKREQRYKARVKEAYERGSIFKVHGNYFTITAELLHRGWLQKLLPEQCQGLDKLSEQELLERSRYGNAHEAVLLSRYIGSLPAFFLWQPRGMSDLNEMVQPFRNRVRVQRSMDFSIKTGLIECFKKVQSTHAEFMPYRHPRVYNLAGEQNEIENFKADFRRSRCIALLRYISDHAQEANSLENGTCAKEWLDFAIDVVLAFIQRPGLSDDELMQEQAVPRQWKAFTLQARRVLEEGGQFSMENQEWKLYIEKSNTLLGRLYAMRPDLKWDGYRNMWIVKPANARQGMGIELSDALDKILAFKRNHKKYIVQKYIERPLLIYKTKFDIRQYFLLAMDDKRIHIWLYKNCYLKFSSHEFSLTDLSPAVHLTNNSVQRTCLNQTARDSRLPQLNMWSLRRFLAYLRDDLKVNNVWSQTTYAGMRDTIIAIVKASLDSMRFIPNTFELYGCDFMLDEDFCPILVEINSGPDLSPSTNVTARICPRVQQDMLKVVLDWSQDKRASTGLFELIWHDEYGGIVAKQRERKAKEKEERKSIFK